MIAVEHSFIVAALRHLGYRQKECWV
jgi:hypothetical protein